ncbi:DNA polymerase IV [Marinobacterium arenosum]|uniref:DNA polymerase IV n=1 Tax=Marinobacterium arenosum TaxID=2862496 RepID=UPI001C948FCF|nr:DNA polymerase IV [Marinobacterium arenosum]MBY4678489.1 DNA polymerase IV [Marinobacterium arenosum]
MARKIIHLDCDCFFAAVEMRDNPALRDIPLAIGGSAERRGVIATCNYPARAFGVRSAQSTAKALRLCPQLTVIPGEMEKYRRVSQQIMAIYHEYTELIEPLSLDEAYLDVSDCQLCQGSATRIAEQIRARVVAETGITVSAGVAPNKFLAKVASDWNKPDGLCVIPPERVDAFVAELPVKRIHGVGEKTAARLQRLGIESCADLQRQTLAQLVDQFGRFGTRLYEVCRGRDDRPVRTSRERKSVSVEHTYPQDLPDLASCRAQLPMLRQQLAARFQKLRDRHSISGAVVKIKFHDFSQTTAEQAVGEVQPEHFERLLAEAWGRGEKPVRLLGLGYRLSDQRPVQGEQLSLF